MIRLLQCEYEMICEQNCAICKPVQLDSAANYCALKGVSTNA
ncbi:hypothetical protein CEV34_5028 [Brucella pseudogrignonensis]|uniref:Uncharacterized protein n=1 Tax=Brucella pseudogrignonensis TaxID=419475 RepID=A0A256G2Q5_9HYPH|nr:hypothetical protein CEV34_5028 [Brucella pseudogrignonensis]